MQASHGTAEAASPKINPRDGTVIMDGSILKYVDVPHDKLIPFLREVWVFLVEMGVAPNWATIYVVMTVMNEFAECVAPGHSVFANGPNVSDLQEFLAKRSDPKSSLDEQQKQSLEVPNKWSLKSFLQGLWASR